MNYTTNSAPHEQPNQARNVMASPYRQESRSAISAKYFLGWFTVPVEVLLRRNFGRRWLTIRNFLAGFILLTAFTGLQILYVWLWHVIPPLLDTNNLYHWHPPIPKSQQWQFVLDYSMGFFLVFYVLFSMVHFFMIWWRERSRSAKHSYDDGTPWLLPIGKLFAAILYLITWPILRLFMMLFVRGGWRKPVPGLIEDPASFTKIIIEPIALIGLMFVFSGPTLIWLALSAIGSVIYAAEKKRAQMNKMRDMRDGMIQAHEVEKQRQSASNYGIKKQRKKWRLISSRKKTQRPLSEANPQYPDLDSIIDELHKNNNGYQNR